MEQKTLTISGKDSYLLDINYDWNTRALYIVDTSNGFKKISSVSIKAGKNKDVYFVIDGTSTWYDAKSMIAYTVKYDGKSYVYGTSKYYGTIKLLNN